MKMLKWLLLALGFYILYISVKGIGVHTVVTHLLSLKWKLLPLLFVYPFIFAFDTIGWYFAFPKTQHKKIPLWDLYRIRIVGETMNAVIPLAASLGGEPIKAELLKRHHDIPLRVGYASILIVHTTFWLSLNIFVISAIVLTLKTMPLSPELWRYVMMFLVGLGLIAVLLVVGLHLGIFKKVHSLGENFKWWGDKSKEHHSNFLELDDQIKKFYTQDPRSFFLSILFNFLGWFTGTFEFYFIGKILGLHIGFAEAWLLEALIQILRIVTFFVPSSIGLQEGGILLIFEQFGFTNPQGLAFAILRRLREILWIGLGLILWSLIEDRPNLENN